MPQTYDTFNTYGTKCDTHLGGEVGRDCRYRGTRRGLVAVTTRASTSCPRATPVLAVEDLAEGGAEVRVEDGVDDGVEQAVKVAEPADNAEDQWRYFETAFGAERTDERHDEEREPTHDERSGNDGQRSRRFALSFLLKTLLRTSLLPTNKCPK